MSAWDSRFARGADSRFQDKLGEESWKAEERPRPMWILGDAGQLGRMRDADGRFWREGRGRVEGGGAQIGREGWASAVVGPNRKGESIVAGGRGVGAVKGVRDTWKGGSSRERGGRPGQFRAARTRELSPISVDIRSTALAIVAT